MRSFPIWWVDNGACACPAGVECSSPGKHPITKHGFRDASEDPNQLAEWRELFPTCNWGTVTGAGLLVVDLDIKPGKNGIETLKSLGTVPRTYTVRTGSGGLHLYFSTPGKLPNTTGRLGPGVDTRCDGGYVLAPGSGHISGGTYSVAIDAAVAPAPEWLLNALAAPVSDSIPVASDRFDFAPATAEILEQAAAALALHGPAVQGSAGDLHTYRAAALLTHDWALNDTEAWPLLTEWNAACKPPWSERDLRAKLSGSAKYGTHAYGCARDLDCLAVCNKLIRDWRDSGTGQAGLTPMVQKARKLAMRCGDVTLRALIESNVADATGLKPKQLDLPKVKIIETPTQGQIQVTPEIHTVADKSVEAIKDRVFQRNGSLCEVVQKTERTFIHDLEPARIRDLMSQSAVYVRSDQDGLVTQAPPLDVATLVHARRGHEGVRILEAITNAPIFLADGTILQERGYNEQARVFLEPNVTVTVPETPSRDDARNAVRMFRDMLCNYDFLEPADFSAWMAGLLSPLVKAATGNAPAPLILISASSAGAGKSMLADLIARIVLGSPAEIRPYNPRDPGEWGKRLTSYVKAASPIAVFDNVNGEIGDDLLNSLITSATWSDRLLGASDAPPLPIVTTWIATGNNIEPRGDTVRRSLPVRIDVSEERPQERTGFKYVLPDYADQNRSALLSAALTILRAYHVAGRPVQKLQAWGSFSAWSNLVRGALVWTGLADPFLTQQRASRELVEPENEAHDFWIGVVADSDGTAAGITNRANELQAVEVLGLREQILSVHLKKFLGRFVDKPRAGKRIRRAQGKYSVEAVT